MQKRNDLSELIPGSEASDHNVPSALWPTDAVLLPIAVCTFAIWYEICSKLDEVFSRVVLTIASIDVDTVEVAAPSPPLALSNDVLSVDCSKRITVAQTAC